MNISPARRHFLKLSVAAASLGVEGILAARRAGTYDTARPTRNKAIATAANT